MKFVEKGEEPDELVSWKADGDVDWVPTYAGLAGEPKQALHAALLAEQGWLCCYCESQIDDSDSHIEHLRPQSDPLVDALDFSNLLCSCQRVTRKGDPLHCGNAKGNWYDAALFVVPIDPTCEARFDYTGNGRILPAQQGDAAAEETIKKLALDIPNLRARRTEVLTPFLDDLTDDELRLFVTGYLVKGQDGRFNPFWATIKNMFGDILN
ncbi:TIGR02646 family protein [Mesorhizobium sp. M8A.F.Ca.ET.207.01.1.1]|uniref:retron system putative HNH endonuclease n=1 Tax=Mesorhizobium sp. M8A.F.Ca.ET.207.01.1.1 TaxID=2563968 RepID=UPI000FE58344|nr:retron system putative HNH endonuclease [Mesorhizobium sp. M8A.F.Ca.ET.207.01.1.1]RWC29994.1 MAG: TIGR02646 family protein [Mesorhizobium sp.]TGQ80133.1 TIGR02646 family protein [Mesorhizobium sp. M8A.F.Ca.ET.207.01.1.1]